ncbi:MAG: hypothetical protein LBP53_06155 [Candidatus Peribacteria bacterium]|nr:hypothetical protein [Candidatus Peribacteria bacterium]
MEELNKGIQNNGIYGRVLDIVDRIAYTIRDVDDLIVSDYPIPKSIAENVDYQQLTTLLDKNPYFGDIVNDIVIRKEQIYFKNPEHLLTFLTIRALMHNFIYLRPELWSQEYIIGLCMDYLIQQGKINKQQLLLGTTGKNNEETLQLEELLMESYDNNLIPYNILTPANELFHTQQFATAEERETFKAQFLQEHSNYQNLIFYVDIPAFKSGSHYLVEKEGKICPLKEAYAGNEDLTNLEALSQRTKTFLFLYPNEQALAKQEEYADFYHFLQKESKKSVPTS